jgi:NAD-dependent DNA ligase
VSPSDKIARLRRELIIHRILYYVYNHPTISDFDYDMKERELRGLCDSFPEEAVLTPYFAICPTVALGSDVIEHYPPELVKVAEGMLHDVN